MLIVGLGVVPPYSCRLLQQKRKQKPERFPQRAKWVACAGWNQRLIGSVYLPTRCVFKYDAIITLWHWDLWQNELIHLRKKKKKLIILIILSKQILL